MKDIRKEIAFLLFWSISILLTGTLCKSLLKGFVGDIVSLSEDVIYGYALLLFVWASCNGKLIQALEHEKRLVKRVNYHRQVRANVLACNIDLLADIVNGNATGLGLVLPEHAKKYAKKGIKIRIENELYQIVWGQSKGQQYQIGLQRFC